MTYDEALSHIGYRVVYTPFKGCGNNQLEYGTIVIVRNDFVFVQYDGDVYGKATRPDDLDILCFPSLGDLTVRY